MSRIIIARIDLDTIGADIASSVANILALHRIAISPELLERVGRNAAQALAVAEMTPGDAIRYAADLVVAEREAAHAADLVVAEREAARAAGQCMCGERGEGALGCPIPEHSPFYEEP